MTADDLPDLFRALAAVDGDHLAWALIAACDRPDRVEQIIRDARPELLRDALRCLAVDVVGAILSGGRN